MSSFAFPIRVAHVVSQLETGGMERLLVEFARHVDRHRFDLQFISLGTRGSVAREIEACAWPVFALETPTGLRPALPFRLARHFREHHIHFVHTHNTKPLVYAAPAARLARVRGILHSRHGQRHGATPRQDLLFRLASRCADRIVCVSEDGARLCRRDGLDSASIRTILNGIDLSRFTLRGPKSNGPAIFVGRLTPEKDVATLLHATRLLIHRCPSFCLKVAGDGPCRAELEALSQSLGLDAHVEFLGAVHDVPALLHASSLFVLPSLTEGIPLTVLEAMACGLPVVATRVGGTPEVVVEEQTGLLVAPGQPDQLADVLFRIHTDPGRAGTMGLAGHQRVREHFDIRAMISNYQSLYLDLLRNRLAVAA